MSENLIVMKKLAEVSSMGNIFVCRVFCRQFFRPHSSIRKATMRRLSRPHSIAEVVLLVACLRAAYISSFKAAYTSSLRPHTKVA
jgi:hypothetical protein